MTQHTVQHTLLFIQAVHWQRMCEWKVSAQLRWRGWETSVDIATFVACVVIDNTKNSHDTLLVYICFFISFRVVGTNWNLYVKTLNDLRPSQIPAVCLCFLNAMPSGITLCSLLCNSINKFGCYSLLYKTNAMQLHWQSLWTEFILQLLPCIEQGHTAAE